MLWFGWLITEIIVSSVEADCDDSIVGFGRWSGCIWRQNADALAGPCIDDNAELGVPRRRDLSTVLL